MNKSITIIGAGIGGLTTALALKQKAYSTTIYESAPAIKPVGAGIIMANNAMQIFKNLGIEQEIAQAGNKISSMQITDEKFNILSSILLAKFEARHGVYNVAIHRAALQKILAQHIGIEEIKLGKRLSEITHDNTFKLSFEDNTTADCDILIGADGIKSIVRNQLFPPSTIRDSQQICWRGICNLELPEQYHHVALEAWGKGKRFGFSKIDQQKVYWYAVVNNNLYENKLSNLISLFKTYNPLVSDIIASTPQDNILQSSITDLQPIKKWHAANACLIGDAAHATTPNLGQGACQAVEDAFLLAELIEQHTSPSLAFAEYQKQRIKKAHNIVNRSWTVGKISQLENPLGVWARNLFMKSTPSSINQKLLSQIFDLKYMNIK